MLPACALIADDDSLLLQALAGIGRVQQAHMPPGSPGEAEYCRLCTTYGHATAECHNLDPVRPNMGASPSATPMQLDQATADELDEGFWTAKPSLEVKVSF